MRTTLRTWSEMSGRPLRAVDGPCGRVHDVLFDDRDGAIRHIVVALGRWPLRRRVLLDPQCISSRGEKSKTLWATMTREEIYRAPHLDTHPPVSRQREMEAEEAMGHLSPYSGAATWSVLGIPPLPGAKISLEEETRSEIERAVGEAESERTPFDKFLPPVEAEEEDAEHLRSAREVIGYEVEAEGARVGRVAGWRGLARRASGAARRREAKFWASRRRSHEPGQRHLVGRAHRRAGRALRAARRGHGSQAACGISLGVSLVGRAGSAGAQVLGSTVRRRFSAQMRHTGC